MARSTVNEKHLMEDYSWRSRTSALSIFSDLSRNEAISLFLVEYDFRVTALPKIVFVFFANMYNNQEEYR